MSDKGEKKRLTGVMMVLEGGVLLAAGAFMPWAERGLLSVTAFRKLGDEAWLIVILGLISALMAHAEILQKKNYAIANVVIGVISVAYLIYAYIMLTDQLGGNASMGIGVYACIAGGASILLGGLVSHRKKPVKAVEEG